MKKMFKDYFKEIESRLLVISDQKINLHIIGSAAIMLQIDYVRGTKDADVIDLIEEDSRIMKELQRVAGVHTPLAQKHGMYIDIVKRGIPLMPQSPLYHPLTDINSELKYVSLHVLDLHDVVVSKLKPFRAQDVEDIKVVVNRGKINHDKLIQRFESAMELVLLGARASKAQEYISNFNEVERDILVVSESSFELPDWISEV